MDVVNKHADPAQPLFVYLAMHDTHSPYQCTDKWMDKRVKQPLRQLMQCMLTCTDDATGRLVSALKTKGMWANTLMVWSSDNGGPQYWGANNHPLRGGKGTDFQGGVRTAAFVAGGLLPPSVRGTVLHDPIHIADWSGQGEPDTWLRGGHLNPLASSHAPPYRVYNNIWSMLECLPTLLNPPG